MGGAVVVVVGAGVCAFVYSGLLRIALVITIGGLERSKGCSNNNYASRGKCNKCGQPKATGSLSSQQSIAAGPNPGSPAGMAAVGFNMGTAMPLGIPGVLDMPWPWGATGGAGMTASFLAGGSFRVGDWICTCGIHNYSSRLTCRQCQVPSEVSSLSAATLPPV